MRRAKTRESLRVKVERAHVMPGEKFEHLGVRDGAGSEARAERAEAALPDAAQDAFRHQAEGAVVPADE